MLTKDLTIEAEAEEIEIEAEEKEVEKEDLVEVEKQIRREYLSMLEKWMVLKTKVNY